SFDHIELEPEHIVEMIVLEPEEIDRHNHILSASEIEEGKALWESLSRTIGIQHRNKLGELYNLEDFDPEGSTWRNNYNQDFEILSSIITNQDTVIEGERVKQGSWILSLNCLNDSIWQKIHEEQSLTGASVGALGIVDKVNGYSRIYNLIPFEVSLVNRAASGRIFLRKEFEEIIGKYPNEFSCRLKPPTYSDYTRGTRTSQGREYSIIFGRNEEGNLEQQAFRYPLDKGWTKANSQAHCKRHSGQFHDIKREEE
ncbi:unnamed protein product, partial [marine sediment metagenome]